MNTYGHRSPSADQPPFHGAERDFSTRSFVRPLPAIGCALIALLLAVATQTARASDPADMARFFGPLHPSEAGFTFQFKPGAWLPRLVGDTRMDGAWLDFGDDLRLGASEAAFNAELAIRKHERWELYFGGFHFSTSGRGEAAETFAFGGLTLEPGDAFRSDFEMTSVSAELRFTEFRPLEKPWKDGSRNCTDCGRSIADLRFIPAVGVRWTDVDHRFEHIGVGTVRAGGEWVVPFVGGAIQLTHVPELPFIDFLRLEVGAGAGPALGGDGGFGWHVRAGVTWHVTRHAGVFFGYRLSELNVRRDDYRLRGGLQGLFLAGSIRF